MSDGFPDRVTQLRARWQADPTSRVFLQLAEEYRHLGRLKDALEVLGAGLREHPGYLSALVAQGRCLLELGEAEAAREVLERIVQQDVTQMVASKLLVRAYLEVGDAERARQRLDLYGLLNDGDPEIEDLKRRVAAMNRPSPAEEEGLPAAPLDLDTPDPSDELDEPFSLAAGAASRRGDVFDLDASQMVPERPPHLPTAAAPFAAPSAPAAPSEPAASAAPIAPIAPPVRAAPAAPADDDPFPDLTLSGTSHRHLEHLAAEGIFAFEPHREVVFELEPAPPEAPGAPEPPNPPQASLELDEVPLFEVLPPDVPPVGEDDRRTITGPWEVEPEPHVPEPAADAPAGSTFTVAEWGVETPQPVTTDSAVAQMSGRLPPEPAPTPLTATLGQLYQRQGHTGEAERIFRAVLERDPGNAVALAELARITGEARPLTARDLLAGLAEGASPSTPRAKKIHLLKNYLQLLRRASPNHVS